MHHKMQLIQNKILLKQFNDTNTKVDILFIDGAHDYNSVINDWKNYNGFVNSGGYIIFDDYNDYKYSPEVKPAVDEIVKHIDRKVYEIIGSPLNTLDDVSVGYNNTYGLKNSNEFILYKKQFLIYTILTLLTYIGLN